MGSVLWVVDWFSVLKKQAKNHLIISKCETQRVAPINCCCNPPFLKMFYFLKVPLLHSYFACQVPTFWLLIPGRNVFNPSWACHCCGSLWSHQPGAGPTYCPMITYWSISSSAAVPLKPFHDTVSLPHTWPCYFPPQGLIDLHVSRTQRRWPCSQVRRPPFYYGLSGGSDKSRWSPAANRYGWSRCFNAVKNDALTKVPARCLAIALASTLANKSPR